MSGKNTTGKEASYILDRVGITVNKNLIPFDKKGAFVTSGLRLGTPALTTRGMKEKQMTKIAELIDATLMAPKDGRNLSFVRKEVRKLTKKFPLYKNLTKEFKRT